MVSHLCIELNMMEKMKGKKFRNKKKSKESALSEDEKFEM